MTSPPVVRAMRMTRLYAEAGEGFAGLQASNEHGTTKNTIEVATVDYRAVWSLLASYGCEVSCENPTSTVRRESIPVIG